MQTSILLMGMGHGSVSGALRSRISVAVVRAIAHSMSSPTASGLSRSGSILELMSDANGERNKATLATGGTKGTKCHSPPFVTYSCLKGLVCSF